MINLISGVLRGENKKTIEINRIKNMYFHEIHIYSILLLSMSSSFTAHEMPPKICSDENDDDIIADAVQYGKLIISAKKKLLWSGNFSSISYHPLKKLAGKSTSCKVGLGIILGSPFADNFSKKKNKVIIIKNNFRNYNKTLPSSSSIGTVTKKNPNNHNQSSMLFLGESFKISSPPINSAASAAAYDFVPGHSNHHHRYSCPVLMKKMKFNCYTQNEWSCVFAADSTIQNNGSKKLAICNKHRNAGFLSLEDIETTENYSRKINYLQNPKVITHMYNYCILEFPQIQSSNNNSNFNHRYPLYPPPPPLPNNLPPRRRFRSCSSDDEEINFLKNCKTCHKLLEGQDIYIYRGELSFCSPECRYRKVKCEKELEKVTGIVAAAAVVVSDNKESIFYVSSTNYNTSAAGA